MDIQQPVQQQPSEQTAVPQPTPSVQPVPVVTRPPQNSWKVVALIIAGVLVLGAVSYGAYYYWQTQNKQNEPVACTQEAKLCSDGSSVGRTGPNCEFAACPVTAKEEVFNPIGTPNTKSNKITVLDCPDIVLGSQTWSGCNSVISASYWMPNTNENTKDSNGWLLGGFYSFDKVEKICPSGYHIPTKNDWKIAWGNADYDMVSLRKKLKLPIYDKFANNPVNYLDKQQYGFYWTYEETNKIAPYYFERFNDDGGGSDGPIINGGLPMYENIYAKIRCIKN